MGNLRQQFRLANDVEHWLGPNEKQMQIAHGVECGETWQEAEEEISKLVEKCGRPLWMSSKPLDKSNLHERCNLGRGETVSRFIIRAVIRKIRKMSGPKTPLPRFPVISRSGHLRNLVQKPA
ncbi:MAG: hypothetical protein HQK60_04075 [Deltaproteobacteria bacterium]|nr:hypothetical protein [Deltaproteobacteria bacterium]